MELEYMICFFMYLSIQLSTKFSPVVVYRNYIEISEWNDNLVLLLATQCLRFLIRCCIISAQTGHSFVLATFIAAREVLVLVLLLV